MGKLGVFVVLFVFLSASQVMAAPDLIGTWSGEGDVYLLGEPDPVKAKMSVHISNQQDVPGAPSLA